MGLIERKRIFEEINLIPGDKLAEVYTFLHRFRTGLEKTRKVTSTVMQYAGCWHDMSDEEYAELMREITARRQVAFSKRRVDATCVD
jgi:hypothetical protein